MKQKSNKYFVAASFCILLIIICCGAIYLSEEKPADESGGQIAPDFPETPNSSLIVYFSWSGNTELVAAEIHEQTGADMFEIIPAEAYTEDYNTLLSIAQEEQQNNVRPAISGSVKNFDNYDLIYLGFPIWHGDMPMILYTFLEEYDFSGKTIVSFCTSGGSGISTAVENINSMEPNANILEGLRLSGSMASNSANDISKWLNDLGLI